MAKEENKIKQIMLKVTNVFAMGILGIVLWCSIPGLWLVHFFSWSAGATSLKLGLLGTVVPPVGIVNGLIFIITGDSFEQYF